MTEKDIQKISEEYKDEKAPLYEKIHERVENIIVYQAKQRKRIKTFYKAFPIALAMVVIICLAIVLPVVLPSGNGGDGNPDGGFNSGDVNNDDIRYSAADLESVPLNYNLKQYAELYSEDILYIDWYDIAEADSCRTKKYFEKGNEDKVVYLQETITNDDTGCTVTYSIIRKNIIIDGLEQLEIIDDFLNNAHQAQVNGVSVSYIVTKTRSVAKFEYKGYTYYFDFGNSFDNSFGDFADSKDELLEILSSMFR